MNTALANRKLRESCVISHRLAMGIKLYCTIAGAGTWISISPVFCFKCKAINSSLEVYCSSHLGGEPQLSCYWNNQTNLLNDLRENVFNKVIFWFREVKKCRWFQFFPKFILKLEEKSEKNCEFIVQQKIVPDFVCRAFANNGLKLVSSRCK